MIASLFCLQTFAAACATQGQVVETSPILSPLGSYKKVAIIVHHPDPSAKNAAQHVSGCRAALKAGLVEAHAFEILNDDMGCHADLVMIVTLSSVETSEFGLLNGTKRSEVTLDIDLADPKTMASVGAVSINANSDTNTRLSVGGLDMKNLEDTVKIACESAARGWGEFVLSRQ